MNLMDFQIPNVPVGPDPLTWCAIFATVVLVIYAFSGKGFEAPEWLGKITLPDLSLGGRIGVGCTAAFCAVLAVYMYQQAVKIQEQKEDDLYANEVLDRTGKPGISGADLENVYGVLFQAAHNEKQRCILEQAISARVTRMGIDLDPPDIPQSVIHQIQLETRPNESGKPLRRNCYAQLASNLTLAVARRKALALSGPRKIISDPIVARDTPERSVAEFALAQLAPFPTASGWVYLGKLDHGVLEPNPALAQLTRLPTKGQQIAVEDLLLIERTEPDRFLAEPDVTGVYEPPAGVFVDSVEQTRAKPYAYAAVHFATPAPLGALSEDR